MQINIYCCFCLSFVVILMMMMIMTAMMMMIIFTNIQLLDAGSNTQMEKKTCQ